MVGAERTGAVAQEVVWTAGEGGRVRGKACKNRHSYKSHCWPRLDCQKDTEQPKISSIE